MQVREIAERVLFAGTLEEKLLLGPPDAPDGGRGTAAAVPDAPGRPAGLRIADLGTRAGFPGVSRIDGERERGVLLHFLANHELLAAELMALNLIKFPDAPAEYRAGVYAAMREEQVHTQLYLRRMRECGVEFGELPVNGYLWRLVAPCETAMDFVARLNLTFEQANLDFSRHYAALFRAAGDPATAAVLDKIYRDEIGHVGHGLKWFRRWKGHGDTDWEAFGKVLSFPLAPAKAKGMAPFDAEGRRLAGLDEDFIGHLEVCEQSRGRTPVVHWFNPNAESFARGGRFAPNRYERAMEEDLEMVMLALCRRDDILLMRRPPSLGHLAHLKRAGLDLPEIVAAAQPGVLDGRKLGGLRPWAWSPDASEQLRPLAGGVSEKVPWRWRDPVPAEWLSKAIGLRLEERVAGVAAGARCDDVGSALAALGAGPVLFKAPFACAGRGHLKAERDSEDLRRQLGGVIAEHGFVVAEPWLERVLDFSAQYELGAGGATWVGWAVVENDDAGRFRGVSVAPVWGRLLGREVAEFLFREADVEGCYRGRIAEELPRLLDGYCGPVGVDAMVYRRADCQLALRHVVEVNVRATMGRVALELQRKLAPDTGGRLRVMKKGEETGDGLVLNDPAAAREFLAVWEGAG